MILGNINRSIRKAKRRKGSLILPLIFFWIFLGVLFIQFTHISTMTVRKIELQNAADASAYSMALIQARALNSIAILNQGISFLKTVVIAIYAVWAALVAASFWGVGLAALSVYSKYAYDVVKALTKLAKAMGWIQDKIVEFTPFLCVAEGERIALANGAQVMVTYPVPLLPGKDKMILHVRRKGSKGVDGYNTFETKNYNEALTVRKKMRDSGVSLKEEWIYRCNGKKRVFPRPLGAGGLGCSFKKARFTLLTRSETGGFSLGSTVSSVISFPPLMELAPSFWTSQRVLSAVTAEEKMSFDPLRGNKKKRLFATAQGSVRGTDLMHDDWKGVLEDTSLYKVLLNRLKSGSIDKVLSALNSTGPIDSWVMH